MENASKALIIAGGILIAVLVISIAMYMISMLRDFSESSSMQTASSQNEAFNRFFVYSANSSGKINGYEAYNIVRKVQDINLNEDDDTRIYVTTDKFTKTIVDENISNIISTLSGDMSSTSTYFYEYSYGPDGRIDGVSIKK